MTVTREELHHLVDAVDDDRMRDAAVVLRELTGQEKRPDPQFSFVAALAGGPTDLAERHEEYLHELSTAPRDDSA